MRLYSLLLLTLCTLTGCREPLPPLTGQEHTPLENWSFVGARYPCLLELRRKQRPVIRVNCFAVDGVLHTHSNRFAGVINFFGESWVTAVARDNRVRVKLDDRIYPLRAMRIIDGRRREFILKARGYDPIPDGIVVFQLLARARSDESG
jgi:hypothetical protein|tara:strand:+ start:2327 stop:2773 length:447 start_codon:yes stop_codon:yes gene_type:complete